MSDASREADGYEVERSSADQHTAGEQGAENDAELPPHDRLGRLDRSFCGLCGDAYVECSRCGVYLCDCTRSETCEGTPTPPAVPATPDAGDASVYRSCAGCDSVGASCRAAGCPAVNTDASEGHDEWCPLNGCRCGMCGPCARLPQCPPAHTASTDASEWPLGDQHGYSIALCVCEDGPYRAARDTQVRLEERERIAQAISTSVSLGFGMNHDGSGDGHAMAYVEGLRDAADIARLAPDTAGGDR